MQNFRAKPGTRMAAHPGRDARRAALDGRRGARSCSGPTGTSRRRRTSRTTTSRACSTPASTTGAASRRSRSITSIPRRRGPRSSGCARRPSRAGSRSRRGCRSIPSTSPISTAGSTLPSLPPFGARPTRSVSPARIAGRRESRSRCRSSSGATHYRSSSPATSSGADELVRLLSARGGERERVFAAADRLRREVCGDEVTYVVTRNIQYTNVCYFRCGFCAFSKGKLAENLRGPAFLVPMDEIVRRSLEAWERGATEVCLQGGIHPAFTGDYYAEVVASIRDGGAGASTSTRSRPSRYGRARRRSGCRSRTTSRDCAISGSGRCRAPRPRSSTTRCARSSAPTRSRPISGSRCTTPPTASACART